MASWIVIPPNSDFTFRNIPFGIGSTGSNKFVCTRIGETIINLAALADHGFFNGIIGDNSVFHADSLNPFISLGKQTTNAVRQRIIDVFSNQEKQEFATTHVFHAIDGVQLHLPVKIGDFTDFYSSREHATNVGKMFRDPDNALLPNWLHIPIGYHGRSSSIILSGTDIRRPNGQTKAPDAKSPVFGPSKRLDFELEVGFIIGKDTSIGERVSIAEAEDYIFGLVLCNDWSARDVQTWEYVPLGPFLAKNFATAISPWVVTLEALDAFRTPGPAQDPPVLPYLQFEGNKNYDIQLEVHIVADGNKQVLSRSNFKYMYWNMCQQLAHHTSNGCNIRVGDLMASGTISGPDKNSLGSLLEITLGGKEPVQLSNGGTRSFVEDSDTIILTGWGGDGDQRVGFGEVKNRILPAIK